MDDELQQLEAELRALRPAAPSTGLIRRIDTELAEVPTPRMRWIEWTLAAVLPAAALIVVVMTQFSGKQEGDVTTGSAGNRVVGSQGATSEETGLKPIAAEKILVSADDEGLVTLADGTQARRERLHFVDTITWQNPRTNASLKWSVPREEVRVVPISFQ